MLALAHVLILEGLYDEDFVRIGLSGWRSSRRTFGNILRNGRRKRRIFPRGKYQEDRPRTGRRSAQSHDLSRAARSSNYTDSSQIRRSFAIVNALLGNWDRPGGLTAARMVGLKSPHIEAPFYETNPEDRIDAGVAKLMFDEEGSFKIARDAVIARKPYPVKGFVTYKTNPAQTAANREKTFKMYANLDFALSMDITMSDTAWLADLVLPSQCALERTDPCSAQQGSSACACVVMRDPVVSKPLFESKPVLWVMTELAKRMDLGEYFDFTVESFREEQLDGLPGALEALTAGWRLLQSQQTLRGL